MQNGNHWYYMDPELLTDAERQAKVPTASQAIIILHGNMRWDVFSDMLRQTPKAVKSAFSGTPLEDRITPYSAAMPQEAQWSSQYLYQHLQRLRAPNNVMALMSNANLSEAVNTNEFPHHYFCTELYMGRVPDRLEVKEKKLEGRTRTHIVPIFNKWDISFSVGFNFDGTWFYGIALMDPVHKLTYDALRLQLGRQVQVIGMMREKNASDPVTLTKYAILQ